MGGGGWVGRVVGAWGRRRAPLPAGPQAAAVGDVELRRREGRTDRPRGRMHRGFPLHSSHTPRPPRPPHPPHHLPHLPRPPHRPPPPHPPPPPHLLFLATHAIAFAFAPALRPKSTSRLPCAPFLPPHISLHALPSHPSEVSARVRIFLSQLIRVLISPPFNLHSLPSHRSLPFRPRFALPLLRLFSPPPPLLLTSPSPCCRPRPFLAGGLFAALRSWPRLRLPLFS